MTKKDKRFNVAIIMLAPFLAGAAWEFLPAWLMVPSLFILMLLWLGAFIQITEHT